MLPALLASLATPRIGVDGMRVEAAEVRPLAHWPLDEAAGTSASDAANNYTASVVNGVWTSGRNGGGLQLDGASAYIAPPAIDATRIGLTLAAWVKFDGFTLGVDQQVIAKATDATEQAQYWSLGLLQSGATNQLRFRLKTGTQTTTLVAWSSNLVEKRWYHTVATYDGLSMRLYLDGVEVGRVPKSGTIATNLAAPVNIGRNPNGSNYLHGIIDDVRLYERPLSQNEIRDVMEGDSAPDTQPPTTPTLVQAFPQSPSTIQVRWGASNDDRRVTAYRIRRDGVLVGTSASTWYSDTGLLPSTTYYYTVSALDAAGNESSESVPTPASTYAPDVAGPQVSAITVSAITQNSARVTWTTDEPASSLVEYGVSSSYGLANGDRTSRISHATALVGLQPGTTYHYRVVSADGARNTTRSNDLTFVTEPAALGNTANPKDLWRMDEGSGTLAMDAAGGLPASLKGGASWAPGQSGHAVALDGSTGYLLTSNIDVPGTALTLAAWVKHSSFTPGVDQRIISKAITSNEQSHYWALAQTTQDNRQRLQFRLRTGTVTSTLVANTGNIPLGTWYHAAATYDGATMRVYVNGLEVGRMAKSGAISTAGWVAVNIGRNPDGTNYLKGAVDDVRVYDRSLSEADLAAVMDGDLPVNVPPTVSITSPASGANFTPPATVVITAAAADPENRLTHVRFYNGATLIATDTVAPFTFTWLFVPAGSYSLTAVARDADGGETTSAPVAVTVQTAANQQPSVDLTSPADGATFTAPATVTLAASASDPENRLMDVRFFNGGTLLGTDTVAPFTFNWSPVAVGTYVVTAVVRDLDGGSRTSAQATITVQPNQPPLVSLTAPTTGAAFTTPANVTISASASDPENRLVDVRFYNGAALLATDTAAPFTFTWSSVPAGSYTLTAVARDSDGGATTSTPVTITVQSLNQPPSVALTSPGSGAAFTAPATVTLAATASDPENRLADVRFYHGSTLLATDTAAPYTFTWSSVAAGNYTLTAVARDADGGATTSTPVTISVQPAANQPPTVALTAPANGATFLAPATVTLTASASDPEDRLSDVRFYSGGTLIGTDTAAPFAFTWPSVMPGTYTFTAVARDLDGGTTTSGPVSITVQNQLPSVALTLPVNGAIYTAPAAIALAAAASDPENRITQVSFYAGAALLGTDTAAPFTFNWSGVPLGSYSLTAVVQDAHGGSATSVAVVVTVDRPWRVAFIASSDHATNVTTYVLDVFLSGADPAVATPIQSSDLGKPAPDSNNEIIVDRSALYFALPAGNYILTVRAVNAAGTGRAPPVAFIR